MTISKSAIVKMTSSENSHVFIWKDFKAWKLILEDIFGDILTPALEAKVVESRKAVQYFNGWAYKDLVGRSTEDMITVQKINEFRQQYSHIRVYHGCRTDDMSCYYEKGLLPSGMAKDIVVDNFSFYSKR